MSNLILVTVIALVATAASEPLVFNAPFIASPYASAAYLSPSAAYVNPASAAVVAPVSPGIPAVPAVPATYPAASVPYSSVSAYSYGSSYSIQDYFPTVVNANPPFAYSAAYSLPYAYAADYFYRR